VILVCDPVLIAKILAEKADAFRRDPATRRSFSSVIGEEYGFPRLERSQ
jgi:hypothetical protein